MREVFKTTEEVIDYCEGTGLLICILDKKFISFGKSDMRGSNGWRVVSVVDHKIKDFPLNIFECLKISSTAINRIHNNDRRNKN